MTVSLRTVGIALLAVCAAVGGSYVYGRSRVPAKTETVTVAKAEKEEGRATVVESRGPVRIVKRKTAPSPSGPVVTETVVDKAPVTVTTSAEGRREVETETKRETIVRPEKWWRVYGEADWRLNALSAVPTNVEFGADARVLGPLRLGVKAEGNPERLRDTASVSATLRMEF